jgi:hypothetical protein
MHNAEPAMAKIAALELFNEGKLSEGDKQELSRRGIFTNFRKIEGAELEALRSVRWNSTRHPGADNPNKKSLTNVPVAPKSE